MKYFRQLSLGLLIPLSFCIVSCGDEGVTKKMEDDLNLGPEKVQVSKASGVWRMYKDGEPFFIKGVAASGFFYTPGDYGANTIRLYGINDTTMTILDKAHENGLSVGFGVWMQQPEYGFDYTDEVAVQEQLEVIREQVREYKDHPALLFWFLGNELDGHYDENDQRQAMWEAVNDVSKMIHEVDGEHPTSIAIVNSSVEKLLDMKRWAPDLDMFSSNAKYPQTGLVQAHLQEAEWDIAWIMSEYGNRALPHGFPESPLLEWGALVEPTSTEKAEVFSGIMNDDILPNAALGCVGSFAFLWGDKATHQTGSRRNWHSFFTTTGETFGIVDELQYGWTGIFPTNRAPVIEDRTKMTLDGKEAFDAIKLNFGSAYTAVVDAYDTDPLTYEWVVVAEDAEEGNQPPGLSDWVETDNGSSAVIRCKSRGAYRLYVFVKDNNGKAANAVIPFLVE
ncbi:MAG: DUF4434 domain-containing protein [Cyclobacteriaceae bacterium]